jgi:hypothetical protein
LIALACHVAFVAAVSPAAYGFAALSTIGAAVFIWQGVVRRRLAFRWVPGLKSTAGAVLIAFAPGVYPVWSALAGQRHRKLESRPRAGNSSLRRLVGRPSRRRLPVDPTS